MIGCDLAFMYTLLLSLQKQVILKLRDLLKIGSMEKLRRAKLLDYPALMYILHHPSLDG